MENEKYKYMNGLPFSIEPDVLLFNSAVSSSHWEIPGFAVSCVEHLEEIKISGPSIFINKEDAQAHYDLHEPYVGKALFRSIKELLGFA